MTPFAIDGPAVISFSGGRTSGYMLRRILDEGLRPGVHVLFADTGKERDETYRFVREVAARWAVPVTWVHRPGYFEQLITDRKYLPNPVARFCTQELKLAPMRAWMLAHGFEHWTNVVGIRADEPRRVARIKEAAERRVERWDVVLPLATAGVTEAAVMNLLGGAAVRSTSALVRRQLRSVFSQGRAEAPTDYAEPARPRDLVDPARAAHRRDVPDRHAELCRPSATRRSVRGARILDGVLLP